jgi:hypothetical protein
MTDTIKVMIILFQIDYTDILSVTDGLERLYLSNVDIKKGLVINMYLPCTLNYLYLDHTLIDATIIVPYGCKIEYIQPGRNILKELKTLYSEDAILTLRKYKHFFNLYLKNSF